MRLRSGGWKLKRKSVTRQCDVKHFVYINLRVCVPKGTACVYRILSRAFPLGVHTQYLEQETVAHHDVRALCRTPSREPYFVVCLVKCVTHLIAARALVLVLSSGINRIGEGILAQR